MERIHLGCAGGRAALVNAAGQTDVVIPRMTHPMYLEEACTTLYHATEAFLRGA